MRGSRIRYSEAELAFVRSHQAMDRRALRASFVETFQREDVSIDHIKGLCSRNGWTTGRQKWTPEADAEIRALYPDTPTAKVAATIGRTVLSTYQRARHLGLTKSAAYLASPAAGRTNGRQGTGTRFKKGQTPPNKGLRRPGWAPGRMRETQFTKGERRGVAVKLYKPIGTERLSKEGYLERKIHDGLPLQSRWRGVHLVRWEEINGPKPKGMALKCLGDRLNTDPSNWELIPRALLPRLNGRSGRGYDRAPSELKPTIMAIAKLEHAHRNRNAIKRNRTEKGATVGAPVDPSPSIEGLAE